MLEPKDLLCPLSGSSNISLIETIKVSDLIKLYNKAYKINTASEFGALEEIGFYHCHESDLKFFYPAITGSEYFYEQFQKYEWYYQDCRSEYDYASKFIKATDAVLEIGSGKGAFAKKIASKNYIGLEYSTEAKKKAAENGILLLNELIENHAVANSEKYEVVCAFQVLEHIKNIHSFVEASLVCLKPGGLLIYSVPASECFLTVVSNNVLNMPPHHVSWWSDKCLTNLAKIFNIDLLSIEHEPLEKIPNRIYAYSNILQSLRSSLGLPNKIVDQSLGYKLISKIAALRSLFIQQGLQDTALLPSYGQSVTVVYQKPHQ